MVFLHNSEPCYETISMDKLLSTRWRDDDDDNDNDNDLNKKRPRDDDDDDDDDDFVPNKPVYKPVKKTKIYQYPGQDKEDDPGFATTPVGPRNCCSIDTHLQLGADKKAERKNSDSEYSRLGAYFNVGSDKVKQVNMARQDQKAKELRLRIPRFRTGTDNLQHQFDLTSTRVASPIATPPPLSPEVYPMTALEIERAAELEQWKKVAYIISCLSLLVYHSLFTIATYSNSFQYYESRSADEQAQAEKVAYIIACLSMLVYHSLLIIATYSNSFQFYDAMKPKKGLVIEILDEDDETEILEPKAAKVEHRPRPSFLQNGDVELYRSLPSCLPNSPNCLCLKNQVNLAESYCKATWNKFMDATTGRRIRYWRCSRSNTTLRCEFSKFDNGEDTNFAWQKKEKPKNKEVILEDYFN